LKGVCFIFDLKTGIIFLIYVELLIFALLTFSNFSFYSDNNAYKRYKNDALYSHTETGNELAQIRNLTDDHTDYEDSGLA
jgi:hypothetical protein